MMHNIQKRRIIAVLTGLFMFFLIGGISHAVLFDFNSLNDGDNSATIGAYMTGVYGSEVTVEGAFATNSPDFLGPDSHIANVDHYPYPALVDIITIVFKDVPIISMQLAWELQNIPGTSFDLGDFQWFAYDNNLNLVDSYTYNLSPTEVNGHGEYTNLIQFTSPVYKLHFSDNKTHQIGIDDLYVTPVPEPLSLLLLGIGLLLLSGVTYFKRCSK